MGELVRAKDWTTTPLGPVDAWPQSLRTSVSTCLNCSFPVLIWWGPTLVKIYNDAYAEILASKHPEALGRPGQDVWPEIWDTIGPILKLVMEEGKAFTADDLQLHLHRKGYLEECYFSFSYSPIRDDTGRVAGVFCPVIETTARVLAERRAEFLLDLESRLRSTDTEMGCQTAACELICRELGGVISTFSEFTSDHMYIKVLSEWRAAKVPSAIGEHRVIDWGKNRLPNLLGGAPERIEDIYSDHRTIHPSARAAYSALGCQSSLNVPLLKDGNLRAMIAVGAATKRQWTDQEVMLATEAVDRVWQATERRRSESRLRDLNETLERRVAEAAVELDRVWRNANDIFVVIDGSGIFQRVNPAATAILGWAEADLIGRKVFDFIHPDDIAPSTAALERAKGDTLPAFENRYRCVDGNWRTFSWVAAPEGSLIYAYGRDVTVEKERQASLETAQEALRQSQKMEAMGQLTGGVAHDFNNLLTPIVGSLDLLQRKGVGGEREQRLIAGAVQSADRAKTLVQRLLAFARRQPLQSVSIDVSKLVVGMGDLVASTIGPQIKVVLDAPADLPPAKADPNQVEMALLNLAVNARDAMPEGGTLRITASAENLGSNDPSGLRPGGYVRLSVADTGMGMDDVTVARAIEPFFSTKGVGKGTGLGLSMVHGLASQLGGALTIHSQPGLGTNVELWLPESDSPPASDGASAASVDANMPRGAVLLVDDEEVVRLSTADMLSDLGYDVIEAVSGEAAMDLLNQGAGFDILVTDHLMPGMSGVALAHAVFDLRPGTPALLISGYAEHIGVEPGLGRLNKPFRKDELAASLGQLSRLRR